MEVKRKIDIGSQIERDKIDIVYYLLSMLNPSGFFVVDDKI